MTRVNNVIKISYIWYIQTETVDAHSIRTPCGRKSSLDRTIECEHNHPRRLMHSSCHRDGMPAIEWDRNDRASERIPLRKQDGRTDFRICPIRLMWLLHPWPLDHHQVRRDRTAVIWPQSWQVSQFGMSSSGPKWKHRTTRVIETNCNENENKLCAKYAYFGGVIFGSGHNQSLVRVILKIVNLILMRLRLDQRCVRIPDIPLVDGARLVTGNKCQIQSTPHGTKCFRVVTDVYRQNLFTVWIHIDNVDFRGHSHNLIGGEKNRFARIGKGQTTSTGFSFQYVQTFPSVQVPNTKRVVGTASGHFGRVPCAHKKNHVTKTYRKQSKQLTIAIQSPNSTSVATKSSQTFTVERIPNIGNRILGCRQQNVSVHVVPNLGDGSLMTVQHQWFLYKKEWVIKVHRGFFETYHDCLVELDSLFPDFNNKSSMFVSFQNVFAWTPKMLVWRSQRT